MKRKITEMAINNKKTEVCLLGRTHHTDARICLELACQHKTITRHQHLCWSKMDLFSF